MCIRTLSKSWPSGLGEVAFGSSVENLCQVFIILIRYLICRFAHLLCLLVLRTDRRPLKTGK